MDTVFVGSDETGYYRPLNADELRREVRRLEAENADLRTALETERAERRFAQASWLHLVHKGHPDEADYPEPEPPA